MLRNRGLFALPLLLLIACGSDAESPRTADGELDAPAATTPGAPATPPGSATPEPAAAPPPVSVTIFQASGAPAADVDVLFHDADGAILEQRKTDVEGKVASARRETAMVTAVYGAADFTELYTWTGVEPGDAIVGYRPRASAEPTGTFTIKGKFPATGATRYRAMVGGCTGLAQITIAEELEVALDPGCDGSRYGEPRSVAIAGYDADWDLVGMAYAKDALPAGITEHPTIQVGAFSETTSVTINPTNVVPPDGEPHSHISFHAVVGATAFGPGFVAELTPADIDFPTSEGVDGYEIAASGPDGAGGSHLLVTRVAPSAAVELDMLPVLPHVTQHPTDRTDPTRPIFSWTSAGSLDAALGGRVMLRWSGESNHRWIVILPAKGTSVRLPALPETLAAHRPAVSTYDELAFYATDAAPSAKAFRESAVKIVPIDTEDAAVLPANGSTLRATIAGM